MLCGLVWAFCGASALQSFWLLGIDGWRFAVMPLAVAAVVWALLWAPRVVVRADRLEVRNVLVTWLLPMAAIERARLGAMLRFEVSPCEDARSVATGAGSRKPVVVTAWNAPGVGRDRPRERLAAAGRRRGGREQLPRTGWSERLREDQLRSPSHAAVQAWEQWERAHGTEPSAAADASDTARPAHGETGAAAAARVAERRVNLPVVAVLLGCVLALALRSLA